jgi:8-oxo-dGTP pyrophosphatase MutT (NUDIX family)
LELTILKSALSSDINPGIIHDGKNKIASVLVVIYGRDEPHVIMTEKPKYLKFHAGEISFPGGKYEKDDSDLLDTAIRETREEIGLEISRYQVIGQLESVVTLNSRFKIMPFVCIIDKVSDLLANSEVEEIFHIPLTSFLSTIKEESIRINDMTEKMYTFDYKGKIVWGASARILKQIDERLNV